MGNYLQLPESLPPSVAQLADRVAGEEGNWFARAERLSNYLQRHYRFDLDVPPTESGRDTVEDFLFRTKHGYCEHFASSFVVLCRTQGIPARLVTGFAPGEYNPFTGLWEVRMRDAHAWAEVYLPRWGWVSFDPTPEGLPPAFAGKSANTAFDYLAEQIGQAMSALAQQPVFARFWSHAAEALSPCLKMFDWLAFFTLAAWQPLVAAMAAAAAIGILLTALRGWRRGSEKRAARAATGDASRAIAAAEFQVFCRQMSACPAVSEITRGDGETASEFGARLTRQLTLEKGADPELTLLISHFIERYESARFGKVPAPGDLGDLSARIRERIGTKPGKSSVNNS